MRLFVLYTPRYPYDTWYVLTCTSTRLYDTSCIPHTSTAQVPHHCNTATQLNNCCSTTSTATRSSCITYTRYVHTSTSTRFKSQQQFTACSSTDNQQRIDNDCVSPSGRMQRYAGLLPRAKGFVCTPIVRCAPHLAFVLQQPHRTRHMIRHTIPNFLSSYLPSPR